MRKGFSLIEVVISILILTVIMVIVTDSLIGSIAVTETVSLQAEVHNEVESAFNTIMMDLRSADYNYIYLSVGGVSTYTFRVCTGFDENGSVFDKGLYGRSLIYDSVSGTLKMQYMSTEEPNYEKTLVRDVRSFSVEQLGQETYVEGNRLKLSISVLRHTSDDIPIYYKLDKTLFLRSTLIDTDGLNASSGSSGNDISNPDQININWGNPVRSGTNTTIVCSLLGNNIDFSKVEITISSSDLTLTKGWENPSALNINEFSIYGKIKGPLSIEVTYDTQILTNNY